MMMMATDQTQILNRKQNYVVWPQIEKTLSFHHSSHGRPPLLFTSSSTPTPNPKPKPIRSSWKPKKSSNSKRRMKYFNNNNNKWKAGFLAPLAPRNTTSFIIRAKKSGGIASPSSSPCPVTPAVLPTPIFSPTKEVVVEMAKEQWGVDGYGTMKGLIRVRSRSPCESTSCVVDHNDDDLSRFEMIYPTGGGLVARLEEENLTLKERLVFLERELEELRRSVRCMETRGCCRSCNVCSEKSVGDGESDSS